MFTQHAQYVLLFLVLVINSDRFQNLRSYTLPTHPFLCTVGMANKADHSSVVEDKPIMCVCAMLTLCGYRL